MKSLVQILNETLIVEMACSRSEYINLISNLDEQIIQNWCLVYYCNVYDKDNVNFNHWNKELKALLGRISKKRIKIANKLSIIKYVLKERDELNTYSSVRLYIESKMKKEKISNDIIHELCNAVINNIDSICELINSDNENEINDNVDEIGI